MLRAEIAHEVALTHAAMELWDEVLPGRVLRVPYEELVADQARRGSAAVGVCVPAFAVPGLAEGVQVSARA